MSQYIIFILTHAFYYVTIYITVKSLLKCCYETFITVMKTKSQSDMPTNPCQNKD